MQSDMYLIEFLINLTDNHLILVISCVQTDLLRHFVNGIDLLEKSSTFIKKLVERESTYRI